jgi:hypothetical protein
MAMKKTCITLLWMVIGVLVTHAQSLADVTKNINNIKRDTMYIYAEATTKDLNEAYNAARAILEMKVGDWVRVQHPNEAIELCIVKAKDHLVQLDTRRGDFYRAFVYVRKSDIMPVADKGEVAVFEVTPVNQDKAQESISSTIISEDASIEKNQPPMIEVTNDEKEMLKVMNFYDIEPYIKGLKSYGKLKGYGKYATMPYNEDCHLFVYDKQGNIAALLRKSGISQYNLNTLKEDNIKNYKNCGAIWFQIKK